MTLDRFAAGVAAFVVLRPLAQGWLPPITLLSHFSHLLLVPLVPLAVMAMAARRWRPAALLLFSLAILGHGLARQLPQRALVEEPSGGTTLTFWTLNLGHDLTSGREAVAALRASGADVVALQELGVHHARAIEAELAGVYPYRALHPIGISGMGILSRLPIVHHELYHHRGAHPTLSAELRVDGRSLRVTTVHPRIGIGLFGRWQRGARLLEMVAARSRDGGTHVLLGDFNTTDLAHEVQPLVAAGLVDAFGDRGHGLGPTWPVFGRYHRLPVPPVLRLDQIWHTPDVRTVSARVAPDAGSDHLPVEAVIRLSPERSARWKGAGSDDIVASQ